MSEHLKAAREYRPTWRNRRKTIFGALILCALLLVSVAALIWIFPDLGEHAATVAEAIVWATSALAGGVIASYVFGATVDDANFLKHMKDLVK